MLMCDVLGIFLVRINLLFSELFFNEGTVLKSKLLFA